jgi:pimeloyl-ACP methyl ester carboxylesterase
MKRFGVAALVLIACAPQPHPQSPPHSPPTPSAVPVQQNTPETLEARTSRLIEAAARHDFAAASIDFDDAMTAALPAQQFAAIWSALEHQLGPFQTIEGVQIQLENGVQSALAVCRFERSRAKAEVVFDDQRRVDSLSFKPIAVVWEAPSYARPEAFEERSVTVGSAPALPGTLTVPKAAELVPGVVLVHGSGPSDEDESVGGVKVFKDLAWGLATRNIAVLRYVKRSRQSPAGVLTQKEEVLDAAHAAIHLLSTTPGIDPKRIFVLGHSQGGGLAPRIAHDNPTLAGIVVLAGPTHSIQDSLLTQLEYFRSTGGDSPELSAMIDAAQRFKSSVEDPHLTAAQEISLPTGGTLKGAYFLDARGYVRPKQRARCAVLSWSCKASVITR